MRKILILFIALFVTNIYAQDILPLKERAEFINKLQKERLNKLLPQLMEKTGIDMWVLIAREYNEDPIIKTMLPPTWLNARRTTILVFSLDSQTKKFESVAIARYAFGDNIPSIWDKEKQPNQWKALNDYIVSKNPEKIGLNFSSYESLADGLSKSSHTGSIIIFIVAIKRIVHSIVIRLIDATKRIVADIQRRQRPNGGNHQQKIRKCVIFWSETLRYITGTYLHSERAAAMCLAPLAPRLFFETLRDVIALLVLMASARAITPSGLPGCWFCLRPLECL